MSCKFCKFVKMNELNKYKGTGNYLINLFKGSSDLNKEIQILKGELEDSRAIINILERQNIEYTGKIIELKNELHVTDELLEQRQKLLDAIPSCDLHGSCIPNAMNWIEEMKESANFKRLLNKYMSHVVSVESISFLDRCNERPDDVVFTESELCELNLIEKKMKG